MNYIYRRTLDNRDFAVRIIIRVLAIAYFAYLAIAVLVITPALNFLPPWFVKQNFDRDLHTDIILFNPFAMSLEVRNAELPERDGQRFAALDKAAVNLSLESLWQEGWVFDALQVKGLYVHVRRLPDGSFNFSDFASDEPEAPAAAEPEGDIPGLTIRDLDFYAESIVTTDEARETPYTTHWDGLAIRVKDLSTVIEEGRPYQVDVYSEYGGSLHWEGTVSVPAARSEGRLTLSNISLRTGWRFAKPWVQFELREGVLHAEASYQLDWQDVLSYALSDGEVTVSGLDIVPKSAEQLPDTAISLGELAIAGIGADSQAQQASIDAITIDGLAVAGWSEGAQVSLADLFAVDLPADPNTPAAEQVDEESEDSGWTAALRSARVQNSSLRWRSEFTDPPLLQVTPFEASVDNVHWPLSGDSTLALGISINEVASVSIEGTLALGSGDGNLTYQLEGLPVPWINPNLPDKLNATLTDGQVGLGGQVNLAGFAPTTISADGAITNFSGKLLDEEESLTSWEAVQWEQLQVDMTEHTVSLERLSIKTYSGRVHIREDGSVNAQNVWREEVGDKAKQVAEDLSLDRPWEIDIPHIIVSDSAIDFMDESLPINFRTVVGDLNGELVGISTTPGAETQVDLRGSVDGYAPVVLQGSAEPFRQPPNLDLNLTFDGVDLSLLTPYSGTYAGYAIDRGLLNLDLQYTIKDSQLQGNNQVLIDQLKLGDKVDSDKAVDVPLELALALLTDANGVIDMQVPVSGDIDNPEFNVGSVISKAFINIITKAVTAPFTLLANLVGSEEDLQRVNFAIGSVELDAVAQAKLVQLNTALTQRPALKLVVIGRLNLKADRQRLQQRALGQQLLEAGLSEQDLKTKSPNWEKAVSKRYQAVAGGDDTGLTLGQQYDQVAQRIDIPDLQLRELAQARSVAVKTFLVNEAKLSPDRAAIEQSALDDEGHKFSGVELSLDQ